MIMTNISLFQYCNISNDIFWDINKHSLCNITNTICKYTNVNDIFNIHKRYFKVIDIQPTLFLYEEIAYIQSEIWILIAILSCVCCFGIHSYTAAESGKVNS